MFRLLHEKLQAGWKENLIKISELALLLETSKYVPSLMIWFPNEIIIFWDHSVPSQFNLYF